MVIGGGLLASAFADAFRDDEDTIIFASGVSNSSERDPACFAREESLLSNALGRGVRRLVYFSSCGVSSAESTPYMRHKLRMENLVRERPGGVVFRLPQVVGRTRNANTLTNYLYSCITQERHFQVWAHATRNVIDVEDVGRLATHILGRSTPNGPVDLVSGRPVTMLEIVRTFEAVLRRHASYEVVESGSALKVDETASRQAALEAGLGFDETYLHRVLTKYYGAG
jgi:nucleoside-diphosphate-sugar epimerase